MPTCIKFVHFSSSNATFSLFSNILQWPGMVLVSAIAYLSSTVLDIFLVAEQKEIIPVISSFVVSLAGNLYARFSDFPGIIIIFSGFLFLVPGSVGVKGAIAMLISADIVSGLQFSFQMILIGFSLVRRSHDTFPLQ